MSKSITWPAVTIKLTILTSTSGDIEALTEDGVVEIAPKANASEIESLGSGTTIAAV